MGIGEKRNRWINQKTLHERHLLSDRQIEYKPSFFTENSSARARVRARGRRKNQGLFPLESCSCAKSKEKIPDSTVGVNISKFLRPEFKNATMLSFFSGVLRTSRLIKCFSLSVAQPYQGLCDKPLRSLISYLETENYDTLHFSLHTSYFRDLKFISLTTVCVCAWELTRIPTCLRNSEGLRCNELTRIYRSNFHESSCVF